MPDKIVTQENQGVGVKNAGIPLITPVKPPSILDIADRIIGTTGDTTGSVGVGMNVAEQYSQLDDPVFHVNNGSFAKQASDQQSGWQQAGNAIGGGIISGAIGALEGFSYIDNILTRNWELGPVDQALKDTKAAVNKATEIYTDPDNILSWDSSMFWSGAKGTIDSAIQFAIPGKVISLGTKGAGFLVGNLIKEMAVLDTVGTGANAVSKSLNAFRAPASKVSNFLIDNVKAAKQGLTSGEILNTTLGKSLIGLINEVPAGIIQNQLEGTIMGMAHIDQRMAEFEPEIAKGKITREAAMKIAENEATQLRNQNLWMIASDVIQMKGIFGRAGQESAENYRFLPSFKNIFNEVKQGKLNVFSPVTQAFAEGLEEMVQEGIESNISNQGNKRLNEKYGTELDYDSSKGTGLGAIIKYGTSDSAIFQGMMGFAGGGLQNAMVKIPTKIMDNSKYNKLTSQISELESRLETEESPEEKTIINRKLNSLREERETTIRGRYEDQKETFKNNEALLGQKLDELANGMDSYKKAIEEGDEFGANVIEGNIFAKTVLDNLEAGTSDHLIDNLKSIANGSKQGKNLLGGEITKEKQEKAKQLLSEVERMTKSWDRYGGTQDGKRRFLNSENIRNIDNSIPNLTDNHAKNVKNVNKKINEYNAARKAVDPNFQEFSEIDNIDDYEMEPFAKQEKLNELKAKKEALGKGEELGVYETKLLSDLEAEKDNYEQEKKDRKDKREEFKNDEAYKNSKDYLQLATELREEFKNENEYLDSNQYQIWKEKINKKYSDSIKDPSADKWDKFIADISRKEERISNSSRINEAGKADLLDYINIVKIRERIRYIGEVGKKNRVTEEKNLERRKEKVEDLLSSGHVYYYAVRVKDFGNSKESTVEPFKIVEETEAGISVVYAQGDFRIIPRDIFISSYALGYISEAEDSIADIYKFERRIEEATPIEDTSDIIDDSEERKASDTRRVHNIKVIDEKIDAIEAKRKELLSKNTEVLDTIEFLNNLIDNNIKLSRASFDALLRESEVLQNLLLENNKVGSKTAPKFKSIVKKDLNTINGISNVILKLREIAESNNAVIQDLSRQADYYRNLLLNKNFKEFNKYEIEEKIQNIEGKISLLSKLVDLIKKAIVKSFNYIQDYLVKTAKFVDSFENYNKELVDFRANEIQDIVDSGDADAYEELLKKQERLKFAITEGLTDLELLGIVKTQEKQRQKELEDKIQTLLNAIRYLKELQEDVLDYEKPIVPIIISRKKDSSPPPTESTPPKDTPVSEDIEEIKRSIIEKSNDFYVVEGEEGSSYYYDAAEDVFYERTSHFIDRKDNSTKLVIDKDLKAIKLTEERKKELLAQKKTGKNRSWSALTLGNKVDALFREFFNEKEINVDDHTFAPPEVIKGFIAHLQTVKDKLEAKGQTVLNPGLDEEGKPKEIVIFDRESGVAGTPDLITVNEKGEWFIYDLKTMGKNYFVEAYAAENKKDAKGKLIPGFDSDLYGGKTTRAKYSQQLSAYRIMLNNTYGALAKSIAILPFKLTYELDEEFTKTIDPLPVTQMSKYAAIGKLKLNSSKTKKEPEAEKKKKPKETIIRATAKDFEDGHTDYDEEEETDPVEDEDAIDIFKKTEEILAREVSRNKLVAPVYSLAYVGREGIEGEQGGVYEDSEDTNVHFLDLNKVTGETKVTLKRGDGDNIEDYEIDVIIDGEKRANIFTIAGLLATNSKDSLFVVRQEGTDRRYRLTSHGNNVIKILESNISKEEKVSKISEILNDIGEDSFKRYRNEVYRITDKEGNFIKIDTSEIALDVIDLWDIRKNLPTSLEVKISDIKIGNIRRGEELKPLSELMTDKRVKLTVEGKRVFLELPMRDDMNGEKRSTLTLFRYNKVEQKHFDAIKAAFIAYLNGSAIDPLEIYTIIQDTIGSFSFLSKGGRIEIETDVKGKRQIVLVNEGTKTYIHASDIESEDEKSVEKMKMIEGENFNKYFDFEKDKTALKLNKTELEDEIKTLNVNEEEEFSIKALRIYDYIVENSSSDILPGEDDGKKYYHEQSTYEVDINLNKKEQETPTEAPKEDNPDSTQGYYDPTEGSEEGFNVHYEEDINSNLGEDYSEEDLDDALPVDESNYVEKEESVKETVKKSEVENTDNKGLNDDIEESLAIGNIENSYEAYTDEGKVPDKIKDEFINFATGIILTHLVGNSKIQKTNDVEAIKRDIIKRIENNLPKYSTGNFIDKIFDAALVNIQSKTGYITKQGIMSELGTGENEIEEQTTLEDGLVAPAEKFDTQIFEVNDFTKASANLRVRLSLISTGEKTSLGLLQFYDTEDIFRLLRRRIANNPRMTFEEVLEMLEREDKKWENLVKKMKTWDVATQVQFMAIFNNVKNGFIIQLWSADGEYEIKTAPANRNSSGKLLKEQWKSDFNGKRIEDNEGKMYHNAKVIQDIYNAYIKLDKEASPKVLATQLSRLLNRINIDISDKEMLSIILDPKGYEESHGYFFKINKNIFDLNTGVIGTLFRELNIKDRYGKNIVNKKIGDRNYYLIPDAIYNPFNAAGNYYDNLGGYIAEATGNLQSDSSIGSDGNMRFEYTVYNPYTEQAALIKKGKARPIGAFSEGNTLLTKDSDFNFDIKVLSDISKANSDEFSSGSEMTEFERLISEIGAIQNRGGNKRWTYIGTNSDKTTTIIIAKSKKTNTSFFRKDIHSNSFSIVKGVEAENNRIDNYQLTGDKKFDDGYQLYYLFPQINYPVAKTILSEYAKGIGFENILKAYEQFKGQDTETVKEYFRNNKIEAVENPAMLMHLAGGSAKNITELVENIMENNYTNGRVTNANNFVSFMAYKHYDSLTEKYYKEWEDKGVFNYMDSAWSKTISKFEHLNYIEAEKERNKIAVREYLTYTQEALLDFYQAFAGDPAQAYKGSEKAEPTSMSTEEMLDIIDKTNREVIKRNAKNLASGTKPYFKIFKNGEWVLQKEYQIAVMNDDIRNTVNKDLVNNRNYQGMTVTDAAEVTTAEEHVHVEFAKGTTPALTTEVYQKILKKVIAQDKLKWNEKTPEDIKLTQEELKMIFGVHKPVQVDRDVYPGTKVDRIVYVKSASFPILHQFVAGSESAKLKQAMVANKVDRMPYESGVKLGAANSNKLWNNGEINVGEINEKGDLTPFELNTITMKRSSFYIQNEIPYHEMQDKILISSQMEKLITESMDSAIKNEKSRIKRDMIKRARLDLMKELDIEIVDGEPVFSNHNKLIEKLRREAVKRGFTQNDREFLNTDANGVLNVPMFFSPLSNKYESVLASVFSEMIRQKIHGEAYVQAPSTGLITTIKGINDIVWDSAGPREPSFVTKKDGSVVAAEIIVPWRFNNGKKIVDIHDYTITENGGTYIDMSKIDEKVLNIIGFRIPNQGHSSMIPLKIIGFMPGNQKTAIVPAEIVVQMGSDFDVDKLYGYTWNYHATKDGIRRYNQSEIVIDKLIKGTDEYKKAIEDAKERETIRNEERPDRIKQITELEGRKALSTDEKKLLETLKKREAKKGYNDFKLKQQLEALRVKFREENKDKDLEFDKDLKTLQNEYMDLHWDVLTSEEVWDKMTDPLDMNDIAEEAKRVPKDTENIGLMDPKFNANSFFENRAGKKGVAIESNGLVFNAIAQNEDISLTVDDNPFYIKVDGINFNKISINVSSYNKTIEKMRSAHKNIQNFQSEAVDNAKSGRLGLINANNYTFNAINALIMLSDGKKGKANDYIVSFINNPLIKEYVEKREYSFNQFKEKYSRYKDNNLRETMISQYSEEEVSPAIPSIEKLRGEQEMSDKEKAQLLSAFFALDEVGQSIGDVIKALDASTKGIGKSFLESNLKENFYNTLEDRKSIMYGIKLDNIKNLKNSDYGYAVEEGLVFTNKLLNSYYPYRKIFNTFSEHFDKSGIYLGEEEWRKLFNEYKAFVFADDALLEDETVGQARNRLSEGPDNIVDRFNALRTNPERVDGDYLFKNLTVENGKIKYAASRADRTDAERNTEAFLQLLTSKDPESKRFGEDLALYEILTNPIQGPNNFVKFLPYAIYNSPKIARLLHKSHYNMLNENFFYDSFMRQLVQHDPETYAKNTYFNESSLYIEPLEELQKKLAILNERDDLNKLEISDKFNLINKIRLYSSSQSFFNRKEGKQIPKFIYNHKRERYSPDVNTIYEAIPNKLGGYTLRSMPKKGTFDSKSYYNDNSPEAAINRILQVGDNNQKHVAKIFSEMDLNTSITYDSSKETGVFYTDGVPTININKNISDRTDKESQDLSVSSAIIHELTHVLLRKAILNPTEEQIKYINRLNQLRDLAIKNADREEFGIFLGKLMSSYVIKAESNPDVYNRKIKSLQSLITKYKIPIKESTSNSISELEKGKFYGLINGEEFLTMTWSNNPYFREEMSRIKLDKSFMSLVIEAIENLIKTIFKGEDINVFTETLKISYGLLQRRDINVNTDVRGENISSSGTQFAKMLTNPFNSIEVKYKGKTYKNAEHAYQTWKSGEFNEEVYEKGNEHSNPGPKELEVENNVRGQDTKTIMIDILTEKLKQNPSLVEGIKERGGLDYILNSTHDTGKKDFWTSEGQNNFIEALYQAAVNVGIKQKDIKKPITRRTTKTGEPNTEKPTIMSSYDKNTANDKTQGFLFTENLQAFLSARNLKEEGIPITNVKLNVEGKSNQAIIRTNKAGVLNENAFAIISKKYQQNEKGDFVYEEGYFEDTEEDFELFKKYNEEAIKEAIESGLPLNILRGGIATNKASLPARFSEWLKDKLESELSISGDVQTTGKGTGIYNIRILEDNVSIEETPAYRYKGKYYKFKLKNGVPVSGMISEDYQLTYNEIKDYVKKYQEIQDGPDIKESIEFETPCKGGISI